MTKESTVHVSDSTKIAKKASYIAPRIVMIGDMNETEGKKSVLRGAEGTKVILGIKTTYAPS